MLPASMLFHALWQRSLLLGLVFLYRLDEGDGVDGRQDEAIECRLRRERQSLKS